MKTYVLTLAKNFLSTHPKKGTPTHFFEKYLSGEKKHTIRGNYELWKRRTDEVNAGEAILSVREWTGVPYKSPQKELIKLSKVGCQKLTHIEGLGPFISNDVSDYFIREGLGVIALNDGLSIEDFKAWFKDYPSEPMAIIHFTDFRYE